MKFRAPRVLGDACIRFAGLFAAPWLALSGAGDHSKNDVASGVGEDVITL